MLRRLNKVLVALLVFSTLLVLSLLSYSEDLIASNFRTAYHKGTDSLRLLKNRNSKNQLIFPASFPIDNDQLVKFVKEHKNFNLNKLRSPVVFKHDKALPLKSEHLQQSSYRDHEMTVFHDQAPIDLKLQRCSRLETKTSVQIDEAVNVDASLRDILQRLLSDIESKKNPYYNELAPFFEHELRLQLKYNVVERYWYRLAGSSVWLDQYQVHFMISRVLFSPKGSRDAPLLSLTLAQLYDSDWKELVNTKLVVPTNNLNVVKAEDVTDDPKKVEGHEETHYKVLEFPYFLPIPFWHDYDNVNGKYYGAEDPRLLLVKNKAGYEEPLMVFNSYHRKLAHFDDDSDDKILMKPNFYRSMFAAWPWQFQKGKQKTDGVGNKEYDNNFYTKVLELRLKNKDRKKIQKNWTPFVSDNDRKAEKYDRHISFVYRWANLEILKCDLENDSGVCAFSYRMNKRLKITARVGPFRGGTELININHLLGRQQAEQLIPTTREIWVGFARAHIDSCGCGRNMYRPNMVVLTKDDVETTKTVKINGKDEVKKVTEKVFKVAQVSSFISFDVPIIGWDLMHPQVICDGPNVLIPNGISNWIIDDFSNDQFEDYLTLTLSISDFTVHRINIKGLLNSILHLNEGAVFKEVVEEDKMNGFNNDNVVCALQRSTEFCHEYGEAYFHMKPSELRKHKLFGSLDFEEEKHHNADQVAEYQGEQSALRKYKKEVEYKKLQQEVSNPGHSAPEPKPAEKSIPGFKVTPSRGERMD